MYSVGESGSGIIYEPLSITSTLGISYKEIDNSALHKAIAADASADELKDIKKRIALQTSDGYSYGETTFEELGDLLTGDYAYTPFHFKDGIRNRSNIIGLIRKQGSLSRSEISRISGLCSYGWHDVQGTRT